MPRIRFKVKARGWVKLPADPAAAGPDGASYEALRARLLALFEALATDPR